MKNDKAYIPPSITIVLVNLESCVAVGSALVLPQDINDQVQEEWTVDQDDNRIINW